MYWVTRMKLMMVAWTAKAMSLKATVGVRPLLRRAYW